MSGPVYVPAEGSDTADFMIVGEAPGVTEEQSRRPFVGASGTLLRYVLKDRIGIPLERVYITNVCHFRPPQNKINKFVPKRKNHGRVPNELVRQGLAELYRDIARLQPKVIVPVGNVALWALTGHENISRRRGSVYTTTLDTTRAMAVADLFSPEELHKNLSLFLGKKVVPTWHPAAVLRQYSLKPIFEFDLKRAKKHSTFPELNYPEREIYVDPDEYTARSLVERLLQSGQYSADIETPRNQLYCVGYSSDPSWALVLRADEPWKLDLHRTLLESTCKKVFHNGGFDTAFLLYHEGINTRNYIFDTQYAHKLMYPEFKAGLDFLTSYYTDEPYYKDEGKDQDLNIARDAYEYMRYCGKDACITQESYLAMHSSELKKPANRICVNSHMELLPIVTFMGVRGLNVDFRMLDKLKAEKLRIIRESQKKLDEVVLQELLKVIDSKSTKPDVAKAKIKANELAKAMMERMSNNEYGLNVSSNKDVMTYLYDIRGFSEKRNKDTKARTCDEKALKELYGETLDESLLLMVTIRKARKVLSSYISYKFAPKGRFHYSVNPCGTKTQRWSSGMTIVVQTQDRKKPKKLTKTGANAQTLPPEIRRAIIADKGYVLFYADLSAVEDRIVAYKGQVRRKIHAFENNIDAHALTASGIFGTTIEAVLEEAERLKPQGKTPPLRYMGKQSNHAFNYDEGWRTFMLNVNKKADETGIRISAAQSKQIREGHFAFYPEIKSNYHAWIEEEIRRSRTLRNPFGYERQFYGRVPDASTFRDGYSWYPQSTAPEIINRGMVRIHRNLPEVEILLHVHDAILGQIPEKLAEEYKPVILQLMDEPLDIDGQEIHVPVDFKMGERWSKLG